MAVDSSLTELALTQASKVIGKTMGGYSSYGFSLNQGLVNAVYSAAVNNGIPYVSNQIFAQAVDTGLTSQVGYNSDATDLDIRHRISIFSLWQNTRIQCPIQKQFEVKTGSSWIQIIPPSMLEGLNQINSMTGALGFSLYQKFFSRRIWNGSKPLEIRLPMKFVAVNDAFQDVVSPVQRLLKMTLPRRGAMILPDQISAANTWLKPANLSIPQTQMLIPPGPDPFTEVGLGGKQLTGDRIDIYFGKIACFRNVIISDVAATFDSRIDVNGKPIAADVDISFQTYEMYTAEDINLAFNATDDSGAAAYVQRGLNIG
jgi:hypothetical protein